MTGLSRLQLNTLDDVPSNFFIGDIFELTYLDKDLFDQQIDLVIGVRNVFNGKDGQQIKIIIKETRHFVGGRKADTSEEKTMNREELRLFLIELVRKRIETLGGES